MKKLALLSLLTSLCFTTHLSAASKSGAGTIVVNGVLDNSFLDDNNTLQAGSRPRPPKLPFLMDWIISDAGSRPRPPKLPTVAEN